MLAALRQTWARRAFVVSFKLETDESILLRKVGCLYMVIYALRQSDVFLRSRSAAVLKQQCMEDAVTAGRPFACCQRHMAYLVAMVLLAHVAALRRPQRPPMHSVVCMQAEGAINHSDVHVVVANLLETRKDRVWLVRRAVGNSPGDSSSAGDSIAEAEENNGNSMAGGTADPASERRDQGHDKQPASRTGKMSVQVIDRPATDDCIEIQLVGRVVRLHGSYLQSVNQSLMMNLMASLAVSRR